MKRSRSRESGSRKRLPPLWGKPALPGYEDHWLDMDFGPYAQATAPDVKLTNGSVEFLAHKAVLSKCSSVLEAAFAGDTTADEIVLNDVSDDALELLNGLIYGAPDGDHRSEVTFNRLFKSRVPSLLLIKKYNFDILPSFTNVLRRNYTTTMERNIKNTLKPPVIWVSHG